MNSLLLNADRDFHRVIPRSVHSRGFRVEGFLSWLLPGSCRYTASSFFPPHFHSCATETRVNTKSSWGHIVRSIFCQNGCCWQKSKHLEHPGWFWQNLGVEGKRRLQVCRTSVFQHIWDFHLLCKRKRKTNTKRSHTASDVTCCLQSYGNLGREWSRPYPQARSNHVWHGACCTFKPIISLSASTQENPKVVCFLGICSVNILVFFFQREKETAWGYSAMQASSRCICNAFTVFEGWIEMTLLFFSETFHSWGCSDGPYFWPILQMYFFISLHFS